MWARSPRQEGRIAFGNCNRTYPTQHISALAKPQHTSQLAFRMTCSRRRFAVLRVGSCRTVAIAIAGSGRCCSRRPRLRHGHLDDLFPTCSRQRFAWMTLNGLFRGHEIQILMCHLIAKSRSMPATGHLRAIQFKDIDLAP